MTDTRATRAARLMAAIEETANIAREAQSQGAPETGEHWQWVYSDSGCPRVDTPVDLDVTTEFLGEDVEMGYKVGLRSVEEYTSGEFTLPNLVVQQAEELRPAPARHIARHDPAAVLRQCAAHRRIVEGYQWTLRTAGEIASRGLKPWELPANDLDTWDRCERSLSELTPVIEDLAEGYGITDEAEETAR